MFPEFATPTRPIHPGVVVFVGTDGVERAEPADRLPEWLAYAPGADGAAVPVVRVARLNSGFRSFSADGRLLWVGLSATTAPTEFVATPRPAAPRVAEREPVAVGWF